MIYVNLDHLEDAMRMANRDAFNMVYEVHLGGGLPFWRLTISAYNGEMCLTHTSTGALLLRELGVIKTLPEADTIPGEESQDWAQWEGVKRLAREKAVSNYWRPVADRAIIKLDLVTLGEEGSVTLPESWGSGGQL